MRYHGNKSAKDVIDLHFADDNGPIMVSLPRAGVAQLCGRALSDAEFDTVVVAHEKELHPLIDRACKRQGGFIVAVGQSGTMFRRLTISLDEIKASGIRLSTDVLVLARKAAFVQRSVVS